MLIRLAPALVHRLSFNDEPVLAMSLDRIARRCVLGLTGAVINPDFVLDGVRVEISSWVTMEIALHMEAGSSRVLEDLPAELATVDEFDVQRSQVRLGGFLNQAGGWCELTFQQPKLQVLYGSRRLTSA